MGLFEGIENAVNNLIKDPADLNSATDYTNTKEVSLEDVNSNTYTLEDVDLKKDLNANSYLDTQKTKDLKLKKQDIENYSKIKNIPMTTPVIIENQNAYDLNYIKNIGDVTKIEETVTPIEVLMAAEPDFMPNMYNIYFILVDPKKDITEIDMNKTVPSNTLDTGRNALVTPFTQRWSMIGARVSGIDVPQKKQVANTIKFAGHTINKVVGRYERATKLDLSIRLDQSMYVLDAFHALNADCWAAERKRKELIEQKVKVLEGKNFYNFLGVAMRPQGSKAPMLDIVVEYDADYFSFTRYHDLMSTVGYDANDTGRVPQSEFAKYETKSDRVQRFIFHDCKFLGRSSAISFNNSSAETMEATFPFVFRKVAHITADGKY